MFAELPKLFGSKFAIGYFLPGAIFIVATAFLLGHFQIAPQIVEILKADLLVGTTTIGLISWLLGIFLLGANRTIIRLLEGYGKYNPAKLFLGIQKHKYHQLQKEIALLDDKYEAAIQNGEAFPTALRIKRNQLMQEIVERFPDHPEWILPTSFGNTIRAFEVYPRVVYGFESIQGWNRLLAVIPKDYLDIIEDAKSQVDLWINLGLVSMVVLIEYIGFGIYTGKIIIIWLPLLALLTVVIAASRAESAAAQWGEFIKAAFDVFLGKLQKEIGISADIKEVRKKWVQFSQATIYRLAQEMMEARSAADDRGIEENK